jgi:hypothetical protein
MSDNAQAMAAPASASATGMRSEIAQKWPKFTTSEIAALKNKDELVTGVQSKYSLDKAQAQKDVDSFAKGRQL